ncbi:MAG TPA: Ig-like domain-containing protein [Gemmatimonadaceae bacterium]|nr:Ig-like domain-containing protein [Gemmatimonadaceae bacterium]
MRRLAGAVALCVCAWACDGSTEPRPPVTSVEVTPVDPSIAIDGSIQLAAVTRSGTSVVTGRAITWSSNAEGVATVSSSGLVEGVSAGDAVITATSEGVSGSTTVTVDPIAVASITLYPDSAAQATLIAGDSLDLTDTTRAANGDVLTGRVVTYNSTNTNVATVTLQGRIRALAAGTTRIVASVEGKADTADITVVEPYLLVEVNDNPLPVTLAGLTLTGGRAVLYANGRYNVRTEFAGSAPNIDTGAYTVTGNAITMTPDGAGLEVGTGTVSPTLLAVSFGTAPAIVTFEFTR